jgi:RNA-directed DNA polymerase
MNVKTCASSDTTTTEWNSINWKTAELKVKRLQMRIVKAQKEGSHNKVKCLQWLLTHSFYAKALAVKRVTENQGKNTSGVDKELWATPQSKYKAISRLKRKGYTPLPLRRTYIQKSNGKLRPLGIPTMSDRAMQALYKLALEPIAETTADPNSYGFRVGRSTHDAIQQCFITLARKKSHAWILEGDIKGCFDNISHKWLMDNIPMDKVVLRKWLKCGYIETKTLFPTEEGCPQGSIISPALANMTLDGLEEFIHQQIKKKYPKARINFIRYADDFIVTSASKEMLQNEVLPLIEQFMQERGLQLSKEKTLITHINEGFDFLGQNIRKYNGKFLIKPSKKNMKSYLNKARTVIKSNKTSTQEHLIKKLNPIIKGWSEYHKHIVASEAFSCTDSKIFKSLQTWALYRHPMKTKEWCYRKYFHTVNKRSWTFATPLKNDIHKNRTGYLSLTKAIDTSIYRFTKVKSIANPFDKDWQQYFEEREGVKMLCSSKGRNTLIKLWKSQNKSCPVCGDKITADTNYTLHQNDALKQMLHPRCHTKIHSLDICMESAL